MKETKSKRWSPADVEIPDSLRTDTFVRAWSDWIAYRKERKKPLTQMSVSRQLSSFEAVGPVVAVLAIDQSIRNAWLGVFPEKISKDALSGRSASTEWLNEMRGS